MNTTITGKVALITGGSRGIGKAIALRFATEGARIAICGRDEAALTATAAEIQSTTHADVLTVKANMMKSNDIRRFVTAAKKKFDRIDILVNNAGGAHIGGILDTTDEQWEYHLQLKLMGYIRVAREVIPFMRSQGSGKIINIIGIAGKEPGPLYLVPGVVNAALLNFSRSLSKELARDNIQVNSISPASTATPLSEEIFGAIAEKTGKSVEEVRRTAAQSLDGGLIDPEDIAGAALFLASETADSINGVSLNIDAGKLSGVW
ncbi:MAG TPA: SDR family oxidoreductase [Bacteroidota bacterium]|nr:SDR family oxidoreductase [Bacteroidota bacterium]